MRYLSIIILAAIVLASCQKEPSFEDPNSIPGGGGTSGGTAGTKLVRIGTRTGADTVTSNFVYTSSNVISNINYDGMINGQPFDAQIRIVRNAANIITSYVATSSIYAAIGLDSLVTNYTYDAANSRYMYGIAKYNFLGTDFTDSAVFNYDASGKLVSGITYTDDGTGYVPESKSDYTYSGNNVATEKSYTYNGTSFDLDQDISYSVYDSKINPLLFPADAPILGITTFYSPNNYTKKVVTDYTSGSPATSTGIFTYTYNTNNRPAKYVSTDGTSTSTNTYYY